MSIVASPLVGVLKRAHADLRALDTGTVADYIPELGLARPDWFGISVATVDGEVFDFGDAGRTFTIQSISKPFVFGMALEEHGCDAVLQKVGVEPSGDAFNSVAVEPRTNRPFNPMVNAGAIVTSALVDGDVPEARIERIRESFSRFAGRELAIDTRVFESEQSTGDRNRALAWLMRSFGMIERDVQDALDVYFAQCSILVTSRDLALMAATLANHGINPLTGDRALDAPYVANVLSVMTTCGMYDYAGSWVHNVGLPAKSGVAGGVLAVLPGHFGIGVFSPPLDEQGNSVRGIAVCERLSAELQLHVLHARSVVRSVVRRTLRGDEVRSNRMRTAGEEETMAARRRAIVVHELQGDLVFSTAEKVHRTVGEHLDGVDFVVLDCKHVNSVDGPARDVLEGLAAELESSGRTLIAAYATDVSTLAVPSRLRTFADTDGALEWCEEQLLDATLVLSGLGTLDHLRHMELLDGLDDDELAAIEAVAILQLLEPGEVVFREGELADAMYFLLEGRVSVRLPLRGDGTPRSRRVAAFGPGVAFGEMALLDEGKRSADVVCDEQSLVASLAIDALRSLEREHPEIGRCMYANMSRVLARRLRAANAQIRALER
jgi:glutaminase